MSKKLTGKRKIFLTGATGFVGSKLAERLISENFELTILARDKKKVSKLLKSSATIINGNLLEPKTYISDMEKCDIVVHLAAIRANWGNPKKFVMVNALSHKYLFRSNSKINHVIITSSVYAMGTLKSLPAKETAPLRAKDIYGKSKVLAEKITRKAAIKSGLPYTIIRPAIVYGTGDNENAFMSKFIALARAKKMLRVGSGNNLLHLIHVDDLVDGYIKAIKSKPANKTYIFAGPKPISFNKLLNLVNKELEINSNPIYIPKIIITPLAYLVEYAYKVGAFLLPNVFAKEPPLTPLKIKTLFGNWHYDISKAKKNLGFNPRVDYPEGINRLIKSNKYSL